MAVCFTGWGNWGTPRKPSIYRNSLTNKYIQRIALKTQDITCKTVVDKEDIINCFVNVYISVKIVLI